MKQPGYLLLLILCLATSLFAQNSSKNEQKQMTGTICNSACVEPVNNVPTCNTSCNDKTGGVVLVDDQGKVMKIANPKMAMPHMKKKVKVMAVPTEKEREEYLRIVELSEVSG